MNRLLRALLMALPLAAVALAWTAQPARAQCVNGLLANCPAAVGLGLGDFLWADQAALAPHSARKASPAQVLALAPLVFPMLSGVTLSGDCSGTGTTAIPVSCALAATKITSGVLASARLPNPALGALGGVQAFNAVPGQFLTGISVLGLPTGRAPVSADIGDSSPLAGVDVSLAVGTGGAPVVSACGGGTLVAGSTDWSGSVSGMTGSTCTVTYAAAHTPKLNCPLTPTTAVAIGVVTSTTNFIVAGTVTGFGWSCL